MIILKRLLKEPSEKRLKEEGVITVSSILTNVIKTQAIQKSGHLRFN